jgi:hypothetical protein
MFSAGKLAFSGQSAAREREREKEKEEKVAGPEETRGVSCRSFCYSINSPPPPTVLESGRNVFPLDDVSSRP